MKKKNYYAIVKIEWSNFGIEAYNTTEAVERLKEIFLEQYNIELADQEIIKIEVEKVLKSKKVGG